MEEKRVPVWSATILGLIAAILIGLAFSLVVSHPLAAGILGGLGTFLMFHAITNYIEKVVKAISTIFFPKR